MKKKRARNAEACKGENRKPLAAVSEGSKRRGWRLMRKPWVHPLIDDATLLV